LIRDEFNFFVSLFSQVKNCEGKVTVSIVRRCAHRRHLRANKGGTRYS